MIIIDFIPYPLIAGILILTWIAAINRKRGWLYISVLTAFGIYLMAVINLVAFPIFLPDNWPMSWSWQEAAYGVKQRVNLIPFNYRDLLFYISSGLISPNIGLREIGGNVLLTVPFGAGINLLYPISRRKIFWWATAVGLVLETTQLWIMILTGIAGHAVDINDVLLNASGVLIGYGLYQALVVGYHLVKGKTTKHRDA